MKSSVALHLLDVLRDFGVDTVFGIPGGAVSKLFAALPERPDVRLIVAKHETNAAFMAMGYAMATGRPGVVFTTAGPGITNALTGIASAFYEGIPLVYIAGEVARSAFGRGALQEGSPSGFDAVTLLRRFTKMASMVTHAGPSATLLRKAIHTAYSGRRGPVFLSLPLDVSNVEIEPQPIMGAVRSSFDIDAESARRALELLETAQRPLILAGAGARDATARRALLRLAEHVRAPVCVTTKGKGVFPEDHPRYLGLLGFGGHDSVIDYLENGADVLLAVGTGLNDFTTNAWTPKLRATRAFIQIDIDSAQLGKNYPIDLGMVGPADAVLGRILEYRREDAPPRRTDSPPRLRLQPPPESKIGALTTADVVLTMNDVIPADSLVTADMGEHLGFALHYFRVRASGDFFTALGFGSMGSGIVSAVGWQLGAPKRRTFALCGDGGVLMFGGEIATAVQYRAATTFVVINDSRLNMVHHGLRDQYGVAPDLSMPTVDYAQMARSMGAEGYVVRTRAELETGLRAANDVPVVLDVRVDPDARLGGSQRIAALRQFATETKGGS
jgi:acetolactate synthase I/II/III large subunit